MEISDLVMIQHSFDKDHGWLPQNDSVTEKLDFINRDIIGLIGEIGEFSNLIKKLNLQNDSCLKTSFEDFYPELKEELIDTFIYLIRISSHLNMDISQEYLNKLSINKERFKKYENK
ncbi:hypothetical protein [Staphylococcus hominis]|uniref:hypothetical protein n=1 Tax=Staphylococcus hominis TaxID=1290 RepID=UPI00066C146A|nr:hypothetical protein [Staphylococcus hominis]MCI2915419.1 hypothetical protein [Staphylococcus hominis]